jgi:hypothetical protein
MVIRPGKRRTMTCACVDGVEPRFETRLHITPVVTQSSDTRREPPLSERGLGDLNMQGVCYWTSEEPATDI